MSLLFDATTEDLRRDANLPTATEFTVMFWYYRLIGAGWRAAFSWGTAFANNNYFFAGLNGAGDRRVYLGTTEVIVGANQAADTWFHWAVTKETSGQCTLYIQGAQTGQGTAAAGGNPANRIWVGNDTFQEFALGRIADFKYFGRVLTQDEIISNWRRARPGNTENLEIWSPFRGPDIDLTDYSGEDRNWTQTGAPTVAPEPPARFGQNVWYMPTAAAPTGQDVTATDSIAFAEVNVQVDKELAVAENLTFAEVAESLDRDVLTTEMLTFAEVDTSLDRDVLATELLTFTEVQTTEDKELDEAETLAFAEVDTSLDRDVLATDDLTFAEVAADVLQGQAVTAADALTFNEAFAIDKDILETENLAFAEVQALTDKELDETDNLVFAEVAVDVDVGAQNFAATDALNFAEVDVQVDKDIVAAETLAFTDAVSQRDLEFIRTEALLYAEVQTLFAKDLLRAEAITYAEVAALTDRLLAAAETLNFTEVQAIQAVVQGDVLPFRVLDTATVEQIIRHTATLHRVRAHSIDLPLEE